MPRSAHFEIYDDSGEWRWRLRAPNGEDLASGQGFREKRDCERSVDLVRIRAKEDDGFGTYQGSDNEWRWRLRAANGEILASGQGFREERDCERSISLVRIYAPEAEVVHL